MGQTRYKWIFDAVTFAVASAAVVAVAFWARQEIRNVRQVHPPSHWVRNWRALCAIGHRTGPPGARVTILEFADFQCPYCAAASGELDSLQEAHASSVAIVFRNFPLPEHAHAGAAAKAAECAGEQGRFRQYHDVLYSQQGLIGLQTWAGFAQAAGVPDLFAFGRCLEGPGVTQRVLQDWRAGRAAGVTGTPTFIINGEEVSGYDPGLLGEIVDTALRSTGGRRR